jgi:hypothetical protein
MRQRAARDPEAAGGHIPFIPGLALNKWIAQTRNIMGRGAHANHIALSDRDLPRLQPANEPVAATAGFS